MFQKPSQTHISFYCNFFLPFFISSLKILHNVIRSYSYPPQFLLGPSFPICHLANFVSSLLLLLLLFIFSFLSSSQIHLTLNKCFWMCSLLLDYSQVTRGKIYEQNWIPLSQKLQIVLCFSCLGVYLFISHMHWDLVWINPEHGLSIFLLPLCFHGYSLPGTSGG